MQDRAFANPKIEFLWDTVVEDLVGTDTLEGAVVRNVETGETSTLPVTGLFVAIGHRPNTDLFTGVLDMDENGYLVTAAGLVVHERRGRVRLRRRAGPHVPPGDHRRRLRLHGRHRRRALARGDSTHAAVAATRSRTDVRGSRQVENADVRECRSLAPRRLQPP